MSDLFWDIFYKVILKTLVISIPEETFLIMFTLTMAGEFNFLETDAPSERRFYKEDILRIALIVTCSALLTNILKYINFDFTYSFLSFIVITFVLILSVYKLWEYPKEIVRVLIFFALSVIITCVLEMSSIPIVLYSTGKSIEDLSNSILFCFLITLPERVIQFSIIAFLLANKLTLVKANFIKSILSSKFLSSVTISICIINILFMGIMGRIIGFNKILSNFSLQVQLLITISVLLIPLINIASLLCVIYYQENLFRATKREIISNIEGKLNNSKLCTSNSSHDIIKKELLSIKSKFENLS